MVLLVNQIMATQGGARWRWAAATTVIAVLVSMWWYWGLYVRAMRLNPDFESYITGWGAVIAHMSRAERVFDTALYPLLFLTVAIWVLATKSLRAGTVQE
ncbi:polyprenol-phosphate-mannose-dependent alpha-(1-2)-phosphatidylinositol pentamannoside mannosyltransferase [Mycobacteroides abscessus]|uniref:Uncharacterized protein n=2 Tax=Mycobacteroides abscessus TaxID=36809 RepID=A0A829MAG2_9MYCO|nr:hypothetical protein L833_3819 [Mycobacteroides abscessus MAB_091912_2446]CPZ75604.1 polyprenol-phosphate-mannose-dependent alpha-(1-2)-phosphatidylinositol pentamannoside mannosyltransferase [Mycobacteroides abscessus]